MNKCFWGQSIWNNNLYRAPEMNYFFDIERGLVQKLRSLSLLHDLTIARRTARVDDPHTRVQSPVCVNEVGV